MTGRHCSEILPIVLAAAASSIFDQRPTSGNVRLAGFSDITDITETLKELTGIIQGINSFLSGVTFISETIGFGTILLFLAVLVFSAGYSAMGVPKGKASFFSSLVTADALWVSWKMSFNAPLSDYLLPMLKSNLIVLCPLIIAVLIARAAPALHGKARALASALFRKKNQIGQREAAALCEECQDRSARLNRALLEDILATNKPGGAVSLSPETKKCVEAFREALGKIDTAAK